MLFDRIKRNMYTLATDSPGVRNSAWVPPGAFRPKVHHASNLGMWTLYRVLGGQ